MLETVTMTYNDANRLVTYNGQKVKYDEKGNMTYGPVDGVMQELTYDCRNRLVEAGGVSYTYDAENTRIATTEDGLTTEYVTDAGGSLSKLLVAYEADNTETTYYYGAEGLAAQYNSGTGKYYAYHYDNIGSTTLITAKDGHAVERFSYGTYGELLKEPITKIRFLYNGSYGVTTDSNGLYYMRARYYNPDIKRFINQDIKVGDIGSSQSLNRYAYCEGNPVSMVDPFGLCGEDANDQGEKSKYQWLHNALDWAGLVFDGADIVNGILYAAEGDYVNAAISFACGIPAVGTVIAGVAKMSKAAKAMKTADRIADLCKAAGKVGNTAAGMKANYDTYMQARREGKSVGEAMTYTAGAMVAGLAMGKAASWGANKLKNLANKALPKLKTALKENAGKLVNKVSNAFSGFGSKGDKGTNLASYYEYKALKQQGYSASEAYDLMKQFRSGNNPKNEFAFHFTTLEGGKGITDTGKINGGNLGLWGRGVYAGNTPTPSWMQKHIPIIGWGIGNTPVKIPIKIGDMDYTKPLIPFNSIKFNITKDKPFINLGGE